jgi:CBS-domain-containing membrane protein
MQVFAEMPPEFISVARDVMQAAHLPRLLVIDDEGRVIGVVSQEDAGLQTGDEKAADGTFEEVREGHGARLT